MLFCFCEGYFDFVTNATAKELEQFKSVCNQLLSRTYIVRTIYQFAGITADLRKKIWERLGLEQDAVCTVRDVLEKVVTDYPFFRLSRIWKRSNARLRYWKTIL